MTTKQLERVNKVNHVAKSGLIDALLDAYSIVVRLQHVSRGTAENDELLSALRANINQSLADSFVLVED